MLYSMQVICITHIRGSCDSFVKSEIEVEIFSIIVMHCFVHWLVYIPLVYSMSEEPFSGA